MPANQVKWGDYAWTYLTTTLVVVAGVLVFRLASELLGRDGFAEYAMVRRVLALASPALILGFGVGIPRALALRESRDGVDRARRLFVVGAAMVLGVNLIFMVLTNGFARSFAALVFGGEKYAYLVFPVTLLTLAMTCHGLCYAYFRGRMQFLRANVTLSVNSAILPLAAFALFHRDAATVIRWTGWLVLGFSVPILLWILLAGGLRSHWKGVGAHTLELLVYGTRRIPGDFALALLLGLPSVLVAHYVGFREAGFVAFGGAMLTMAGASVQPVSMILLPQATRLFQLGRRKALQRHVGRLVGGISALTLMGTFFGELMMEKAIRLYLGPGFGEVVDVCRLLLLGALPYVAYVSLRSVVDAAHEQAVNAQNIFIALAVLAATSWLGLSTSGGLGVILLGAVASLWTLGGLTVWQTWRILWVPATGEKRATGSA